jgi:hypothetical protein
MTLLVSSACAAVGLLHLALGAALLSLGDPRRGGAIWMLLTGALLTLAWLTLRGVLS